MGKDLDLETILQRVIAEASSSPLPENRFTGEEVHPFLRTEATIRRKGLGYEAGH